MAAVEAGAAPLDDSQLVEKPISSERAFEGKLVKVDALRVEMPDGQIKRREVVRHPGAVALIALDGRGHVLMERQMRIAVGEVITEIPAGKIDPGETPEQAAVRELSEETGYTAGRLEYLFPMGTAIGYSDEILHFFLATELEEGEAHLDSGEFLSAWWMDIDELVEGVLAGKIYDSKTMVAGLYLAHAGLA